MSWRGARMRDNGIRLQFASIKATEGEKLIGRWRNWQLSRENGLLRGAYHYFSPWVGAAPVQARLFLQTVDFSQGDFPAVLDVEEQGKIIGKRITQTSKSVAKKWSKKYGKKADYLLRSRFLSHQSGGLFQ
ncbi:GH25 family lysozyme [Escherichia coli]